MMLRVLGIFLIGLALRAQAGVTPQFCTDLSGIPETPGVDFTSQIQPIFANNGCETCHGGSGNLYLTPGQSYSNLVSVPASAPVPVNRVEPGNADQSFLFWKVNCDSPGSGSRMPIGGTLSEADQALIRDWINQGALPAGPGAGGANPVPGLGWVGQWLLVLLLLSVGLARARRALLG